MINVLQWLVDLRPSWSDTLQSRNQYSDLQVTKITWHFIRNKKTPTEHVAEWGQNKAGSQSFNLFCNYKQEAVYQMNSENISQTVFSWTPTSQLYLPLHVLRVFLGFLLLSALFCSPISPVSLLHSHPPTHTSVVTCATSFPVVPLPLPHLPSSRFSNTSRKPKLLSPLVDWCDGSKESQANGKMIDFPYVDKIMKFDSTGFISRFCKATSRLFWLLYRLFS